MSHSARKAKNDGFMTFFAKTKKGKKLILRNTLCNSPLQGTRKMSFRKWKMDINGNIIENGSPTFCRMKLLNQVIDNSSANFSP